MNYYREKSAENKKQEEEGRKQNWENSGSQKLKTKTEWVILGVGSGFITD